MVNLIVAAKPGSSGGTDDSCPLPLMAVPQNGGLAREDGIAGAVWSGSAIVGQNHSGPIHVAFSIWFWLKAGPDITSQEAIVNPASDVPRRHLELLRLQRSSADLGSSADYERDDDDEHEYASGLPKQFHFGIMTQPIAPCNLRSSHFNSVSIDAAVCYLPSLSA
ncbi:MAG TPA: hypothetical protein VNO50_04445 [Pyrinomonadaceae bacterium]|nr:hypothetical protein [Pyrinomonadaceae bacterium]